jgi:hypothetical protein
MRDLDGCSYEVQADDKVVRLHLKPLLCGSRDIVLGAFLQANNLSPIRRLRLCNAWSGAGELQSIHEDPLFPAD